MKLCSLSSMVIFIADQLYSLIIPGEDVISNHGVDEDSTPIGVIVNDREDMCEKCWTKTWFTVFLKIWNEYQGWKSTQKMTSGLISTITVFWHICLCVWPAIHDMDWSIMTWIIWFKLYMLRWILYFCHKYFF